MKLKKADLSMNMIVVAALAIIVLLIVVMIFSGKMRSFGNTMQSCEAQGGECSGTDVDLSWPSSKLKEICNKDNSTNYIILRGTDCEENENNERICCKKILGN